MTEREWSDLQQRDHNLASYRWRQPRKRFKPTDTELRIAVESLERAEQARKKDAA